MKKVCVITGSRSEYGILKSVIKEIQKSQKLELFLLVTGMHLLEKYGNTIEIIKKDGIPIQKTIPMYSQNSSDKEKLGEAVSRAISNFSKAFREFEPDIILVLGDRYEVLAAVIAATTQIIPIAHIHGGDNVSQGQVDEQIRHAVTKFSHVHFPATPKSYKRIRLMGEESWRIHMVGSPSIDLVYNIDLLDNEELVEKFNINFDETNVICVQHPYTIEPERAGNQMRLTLKVLNDLNLKTILIYPNNDLGSKKIIEEIEKYRDNPKFKIFKNLDRKEYLSLLKYSDLMIGNSSSGLIETPIFKIPVVNIGDRNKGRESGENVINVPHDYEKIRNAVKKALSKNFKEQCKNVENPYGNGQASKKVREVLENLKINKNLIIKKLSYNV